jgi:hypothetical protein
MTFNGALILEDMGTSEYGRAQFKLQQLLVFSTTCHSSIGLRVSVPRGFVTDFASVPRLFWPIFPPSGKWNRAAVVHDYLCTTKTCSRFMADAVFREAMRELGVPRWRRVLMYYAVRAYSIMKGLR